MKMDEENDVAADYESSLSELTFNSKPHINMLTMLAEEYVNFAPKIVEVIESHLHKVPASQMLPTLYLIDSIVKNLPNSNYKDLFKKNLVKTFVPIFEKGDEKTRAALYKLRATWTGYFPPSKLYAIDIKVHGVDKAWPVQQPDGSAAAAGSTATASTSAVAAGGKAPKSIHVNPDFLGKAAKVKAGENNRSSNGSSSINEKRELLLKLQQQKRELEALEAERNRTIQQTGRLSMNASSSHHHVQLQSVVTVPSPSQRDPRLLRGARGPDSHRASGSSDASSHRTDRSSSRGGSAEAGDRRQQPQQQFQDVDLRARSSVPSLPPKKRKPQSPLVDSEPETSFGKEKKKRPDADSVRESPNPFGTKEDQDFRVLYRPPPPTTKIKEEIAENECVDSAVVQPPPIKAAVREKTPTRPISPAVQQILAAASSAVTPTTSTAPLANVRISVDAPELPDHSLKTLVAYSDTILQRTEQQLNEGQITRQQYNDIMRDFNLALDEAQFGGGGSLGAMAKGTALAAGIGRQPLLGADTFPPPAPPQIRPSVTAPAGVDPGTQAPVNAPGRENAAFDPIPANNRIFVDGRAYEVRYIDDVAVIERNGLPHRIYFVGTPRDVVVDGFAHTLAFGESKTITIDGQTHVIRFGAPSRELYMGPSPFRGSFGGPPIGARIGGVQHKIQLCGPPPEVKIDPEPAYELLRYVKESHMPRAGPTYDYASGPGLQPSQQPSRRPVLVPSGPAQTPALGPSATFQQPPQQQFPPLGQAPFESQLQRPFLPMQPQPTHQPADVMDLYTKLVNSGIIASTKQQERQLRQGTPPVITKNRFGDEEVVERKTLEPDLTDFALGLTKVRYASVIEALYRQKVQCGTCGMRFSDGDRQKYSKHLDWHFQQGRRDKEKSNVRPWYLAADDWIRYEESVGDSASKLKSTVFESSQKEQQPQQTDDSGRILVASTDSVIPATEDDQECAVCGEKFETFWDEDEEVWKLRNATLIRGKAYHPLCYQDVRSTDIESETTPSFVPLPDDFMASNSSGEESKNID